LVQAAWADANPYGIDRNYTACSSSRLGGEGGGSGTREYEQQTRGAESKGAEKKMGSIGEGKKNVGGGEEE